MGASPDLPLPSPSPPRPASALGGPGPVAALLDADPTRAERVLHRHHVDARAGRTADWPSWVDPSVRAALHSRGIRRLWHHQVAAAAAAHEGRPVVIATGTASGKSAAYLLPTLTALLSGARAPTGRGTTALYLSPTKALAADQLDAVQGLALPGLRAATYDGDVPMGERRWVRDHAQFVLTNPDMLHRSLLPDHARWAPFWRALRYVVIDECHRYRGLFGAHVAAVIRRLRRIAARYGAEPVFVLASATAADPARAARQLTGLAEFVVVDDDTSARGATTFWLWEPPLVPGDDPHAAGVRRSAGAETSDLLVDLVSAQVRTLAFVRSRRGAETVATTARAALARRDPELGGRVAAYRGGYLPEERRELEGRLRSGSLLGLASTNALELGVDVHGLDAVVVAGWPGTRSSLWQQAGRAGRSGGDSLAILVGDDDPLDTYVVHHPEAVFGADVEAVVLDPDNPHVLGPHLCAAAYELPLTEPDLDLFGPSSAVVLRQLESGGLLRHRPAGWYWTHNERPSNLTDLRGAGSLVSLVESDTGRVLGTVEEASAHTSAHPGAVYVHQGATHVVEDLDEEAGVALLHREDVDYSTSPRRQAEVRVIETSSQQEWGHAIVATGVVEVTTRVSSYLVRSLASGRVTGEYTLDLAPRIMRTRAVWWSLPAPLLAESGVGTRSLAGAVHAVEHAAIGLLPLVATCDRWDVGGAWSPLHPDTGEPTVIVHDAAQGGAGFAARGYWAAATWLRAAAAVIDDCECLSGCPSCVQSPSCGSGNDPLDKGGALRVLRVLLAHAPAS